jgi:hypothetical protein
MAANMNITGCCNSDTSPKPQSSSLCPAAVEQFRQLREIDCHLSHLLHHQKQRVENAEKNSGGYARPTDEMTNAEAAAMANVSGREIKSYAPEPWA